MDMWHVGGTSISGHDQIVIRGIMENIGEDDDNYDFDLEDEDVVMTSSSEHIMPDSRFGYNIEHELHERMSFTSKETTLNVIKQYHINNNYKFFVKESKPDKFVVCCMHHDNEFQC